MFSFSSKKIVVTHNGGFHPDDVFAVATLSLLLNGRIKVVRTRNKEKISRADYVVDVGAVYDNEKNRFDHHQQGGAGARMNGVPYASFGLVWKHFGEKITKSKEIAEIIDRDLVQYIDAMDNGVGELKPIMGTVIPFTIGMMIMDMNPVGNINQSKSNEAFERSKLIAERVLKNKINIIREELSTRIIIQKIYDSTLDKRLILLESKYPWSDVLKKYPEPLFVVGPREVNEEGRLDWEVVCVRDNPNSFINRRDLPESWAGKRDKELSDVTGVPDAVFCHNKRFMAVARSKEGALKLAELALKNI